MFTTLNSSVFVFKEGKRERDSSQNYMDTSEAQTEVLKETKNASHCRNSLSLENNNNIDGEMSNKVSRYFYFPYFW